MAYHFDLERPLYHWAHRDKLDRILRDGVVSGEVGPDMWFCLSVQDTLEIIRSTGVAVDCPEDYVILKLTPYCREGEWVRPVQAGPLVFQGSLAFYDPLEIIRAAPLLKS